MGVGWTLGSDELRALLGRIGAIRWGWTVPELAGVLDRLGWSVLESDELGVMVDLGSAFAESGWPTTRVARHEALVRTTSLVLTAGNADDAADALRLGDVFDRLVQVTTEVIGPPSDRQTGFLQVATWRGLDDRGTLQLRQHRYAVNLRWASNLYQVTLDQRDERLRAEAAAEEPEKPEVAGERLIEQVLQEEPSWERFGLVFTRALNRLRDGSTLILGRPENNYLQFQYSPGDFSLEVSSNGVRKGGARLSAGDEQTLRDLGFVLPRRPFEDENWRYPSVAAIDAEVAAHLSGLVVSALRGVVRVQRPAELSVQAFNAVDRSR